MAQALWVKKDSLAETQMVDLPDAPLAEGAVRLTIQSLPSQPITTPMR